MEEDVPVSLCTTCLCIVNKDRTQLKPSKPTVSCPICRLVLSAINFARSLEIQNLRSYALGFTRIIYDHDIRGSTASSGDLTKSQRDWTIQCSIEEVIHKELYTKYITKVPRGITSGIAEDHIPVTTASVHRAIDIHYRIPITALNSTRNKTHEPKEEQNRSIPTVSSFLRAPELDWSSTFRSARKSIHTCQSIHSHCQVGMLDNSHGDTTTGFPYDIRLLYCADSPSGPKFRLSVFRDEIPLYITLSHRWSVEQPWKTTNHNFHTALLDIPYQELPKTIRDAAAIARELGIVYLWIDSISIIQDESKDWTQQSSQMGLVFAKSYCTLAAIDAFAETDSDMGLMISRDKVPAKVSIRSPFEFKYDNSQMDDSGHVQYTHRKEPITPRLSSDAAWESKDYEVEFQYTPFEMSIEKSVWNTRGWVFQERLLSKRLLYFTKEQVFWECAEGIEDEQSMGTKVSGGRGVSATDIDELQTDDFQPTNHHLHRMLRISERDAAVRIQKPTKSWKELEYFDIWDECTLLKVWWPITERYTQCRLTFTKDRWFAIQGLCDVLQRKFDSGLHAGIWDIGVGACLLWHARKSPLSPFSDFKTPSWSWLGLNGPISYAYEDESYTGFIQEVAPLVSGFAFDNVTALNDARDTMKPTTPYGFSGRLCLTCPTNLATVSVTQFKDLHFREQTGQTTDSPAWKFFLQISDNRSQLELEREYCTVDLPQRTQLLMASNVQNLDGSSTRAIGWVVLDQDIQPKGNVLCAAVVLRVLYGQKQIEQHIIECIVLEEDNSDCQELYKHNEILYRRIGRGRIVEKEWLDGCKIQTIYCI